MSMHAMTMEAQGIAGGISKQLGDFTSQFGRRGESTEYKQLPNAVTQARQKVEEAIQLDEQEAGNFWNELKMLFRDGLDYFNKKKQFDDQAEALVQATRNLMNAIARFIESTAIPKMDVPDELKAAAEQWHEAHRRALSADQAVPTFKRVEGWDGKAYSEYQTMTEVQVQALNEYREFPRHMAEGYLLSGQLNAAVLGALYDAVKSIEACSQNYPPGGANEFYVRTSAMCRALQAAFRQIIEIVGYPADSANELSTQLETTHQSPVVIAGGSWPHGTSQAGQQAGDTSGPGGAQPGVPDLPDAPADPGDGGGIDR